MSQVTEPCSCPVKGVIDVVSKKWTLLIVNTLGIHVTLRFIFKVFNVFPIFFPLMVWNSGLQYFYESKTFIFNPLVK